MYYTNSVKATSPILLFVLSVLLLPFSSSTDLNHCDDDPGYTFGRYTTAGGEVVTRTCAWIKLIQSRNDEWCNAQWLQNTIKDKCPETCLKKECLPPDIGRCVDKSPGAPIKWHDRGGEQYTCEWYSTGRYCNLFGNDFRNYNMTANEACCVCGGGDKLMPTTSPIAIPTPSPTAIPTPSPNGPSGSTCIDNPIDWYDSGGEFFDCIWYGSDASYCANWGDLFENFNATANQACCVCGGGDERPTSPTTAPLSSPTMNPTLSPTSNMTNSECIDNPVGWYDSDGPNFNCTWYGLNATFCADWGDMFENFNTTANKACCICGGGLHTNSSDSSNNDVTLRSLMQDFINYIYYPENEDEEWRK